MTEKNVPTMAPIRTSNGQWTPMYTLLYAIRKAKNTITSLKIFKFLKINEKKVARAKEFDACAEKKLNFPPQSIDTSLESNEIC